jgi:hypothetical protein
LYLTFVRNAIYFKFKILDWGKTPDCKQHEYGFLVRASVLSQSTLSQFGRENPIFANISYKIGMHPFGLFVLNKIGLTHGGSETGFDGRKDAL